MKTMNYREVLFPYQPLEPGDFMYRYEINNREYIIYSPEKDKVSCLELYDFMDISPFQLAISIQRVKVDTPELKEFEFAKVCSKENLIKYLFDIIDNISQYRRIRGVSNFEAYFLFHLKHPTKVRNIYQFNPNNNESQLVFDNDVCIAAIFDDIRTQTINLCWDPVTFRNIEEQDSERYTSYLLASSNPMICEHIYKKVDERSATINIYNYSLDALLFFSYYIKKKGIEKSISIFSDSKNITVLMSDWYPTTLVRFISKIQKMYNLILRKKYEEFETRDITVYQLISIAGSQSFLRFPNDAVAIEIFFKEIVSEYKLDDISLKCIS